MADGIKARKVHVCYACYERGMFTIGSVTAEWVGVIDERFVRVTRERLQGSASGKTVVVMSWQVFEEG